jgi:hypothetical protein
VIGGGFEGQSGNFAASTHFIRKKNKTNRYGYSRVLL